jgi:hypothetical protein
MVPRSSGPVFMFYAPGLIFGGIGSDGPFFMFCAPRLVFDSIGCDMSRFLVLRSRTRIQRYRGRRVPLLYFALPDSFSTVSRASCPVFMFCAPGLFFGGTEGVGSCFHVLRFRTHFQRYRRRLVLFSCFALSDSFSAIPRASGPVFMFCALRLIFTSTECVGSCFHVLRAQTHFRRTVDVSSHFHVLRARTRFWRYRGRRVPFSCFALLESFSAVPRASCPVFIFFTTVLIFGGTVGVSSRFHVLRARTCFRLYRGCQVPYSCFARTN